MLDLVIIGASAAGCSAAIYAARRKLNFVFLTDDVGGEVALSGVINNWPGTKEIQGFELANNFAEHVRSYGVTIEQGWRVTKISTTNNIHTVTATNGAGEKKELEAKTVIITTGIHPRHLGVPGEEEFNRKGVTYCTVCDGPLFKNKTTVTVGSGNAALESALMMAGIAQKTYLLSKFPNAPDTNGGFPKGENILIDSVKKIPNIEIIYGAETLAITGTDRVTHLTYRDATQKTGEIITNAVMVHIGQIPNSDFADSITKNPIKEIMVDNKCRTNVPGIFAAGDVTDVAYKQIGIAVGQGITAALASIEYLNRWQA